MWYRSIITYRNPKGKSVTESFLHDGVSYGDIEAQLVECLKGRVSEWDQIKNERVRFGEVLFNNSQLPFYLVKVRWEGDGESKSYTTTVLVPAENPIDAQNRVTEYYGYANDYSIEDTVKTKYLGIWHPHNMIWKGDFLNRMDERKEAGFHTQSSELNSKKNDDDIDNNPEGEETDDE